MPIKGRCRLALSWPGSGLTPKARRLIRLAFIAAVVATSLAAVDAPGASASCTTSSHCYALSRWQMTNGFAAEGESIKVDTITDVLPGWASGNFFTNEVWVGFDGEKHWVESGQVDEGAETGLYYFWAYKNAEGYYEGFPWNKTVRPTTNQWNTYEMLYEPSKGANSWGIWINGTGVQVGTGMESVTKNFEAGLEMTETGITNTSETTESLTQHTNGSWSNGWEASGAGSTKTEPVGPTCVKEINHAWAYFYGAKPCGQNGWEPSMVQAQPQVQQIVPIANAVATTPATPEEAARISASKYGDASATIEQKNKTTYVLRGHFRLSAHVPRNAEAPTGTVLTVTVDPETNQVVEITLK